MNAAHLTPTLDTCEALKRADFPQDTVFVWASRARPSVSPRGTTNGERDGEHAAPTLTELLANLPTELAFALPHPIFGSTDRTHTLEVSVGPRAVIGYHTAGSREVQHRTEHDSAVEAAARLYLALHAAGRLSPPRRVDPPLTNHVREIESLARAA
jgi:hypothetical protein